LPGTRTHAVIARQTDRQPYQSTTFAPRYAPLWPTRQPGNGRASRMTRGCSCAANVFTPRRRRSLALSRRHRRWATGAIHLRRPSARRRTSCARPAGRRRQPAGGCRGDGDGRAGRTVTRGRGIIRASHGARSRANAFRPSNRASAMTRAGRRITDPQARVL
jgi:hypothetical protein